MFWLRFSNSAGLQATAAAVTHASKELTIEERKKFKTKKQRTVSSECLIDFATCSCFYS